MYINPYHIISDDCIGSNHRYSIDSDIYYSFPVIVPHWIYIVHVQIVTSLKYILLQMVYGSCFDTY